MTHIGSGAIAVDYNKGRLGRDIYVTSWGAFLCASGTSPAHKLYRNNGNGRLPTVAVTAGHRNWRVRRTASARSFGDYDLDSNLDLAVAGGHFQDGQQDLPQLNGDSTFGGVTSSILGGFSFSTDPRRCAGSRRGSSRYGSDHTRPPLWTADRRSSTSGTTQTAFTEITGASGTGLGNNGAGAYVADLDRDNQAGLVRLSITTTNWSRRSPANQHVPQPREPHLRRISNPAGVKQRVGAQDPDRRLRSRRQPRPHHDQQPIRARMGSSPPTRRACCEQHQRHVYVAGVCGIAPEQGRGLVTFDADSDRRPGHHFFSPTPARHVLPGNELGRDLVPPRVPQLRAASRLAEGISLRSFSTPSFAASSMDHRRPTISELRATGRFSVWQGRSRGDAACTGGRTVA